MVGVSLARAWYICICVRMYANHGMPPARHVLYTRDGQRTRVCAQRNTLPHRGASVQHNVLPTTAHRYAKKLRHGLGGGTLVKTYYTMALPCSWMSGRRQEDESGITSGRGGGSGRLQLLSPEWASSGPPDRSGRRSRRSRPGRGGGDECVGATVSPGGLGGGCGRLLLTADRPLLEALKNVGVGDVPVKSA